MRKVKKSFTIKQKIDSTDPSHKSRRLAAEHLSQKKAEYAAQLAAKEDEIKTEDAIAAQRQELKRLENQRDLQVMSAKLRVYSEVYKNEVMHDSMVLDRTMMH